MNKSMKIIMIIIIVICSVTLLLAVTNSIDWIREPLVADTNVTTIMINQTVTQGDITFTIDRLEAGDKFTTIYYEMTPVTEGELLKGAQLYYEDTPLEIISTPGSMNQGQALCFAPVEEPENLTLYIAKVKDYSDMEKEYELYFENNQSTVPIEMGGKQGTVSVFLENDSVSVILDGIEDLSSDIYTTRTGMPANVELYSSSTKESGLYPFSIDNIPTHIRISLRYYTYENDPMIISIS